MLSLLHRQTESAITTDYFILLSRAKQSIRLDILALASPDFFPLLQRQNDSELHSSNRRRRRKGHQCERPRYIVQISQSNETQITY